MKTKLGVRFLLPGLLAAGVSGCATYPISKDLRQQAQPATLAQVLESPPAYQGRVVIWGGRIISAANDTNGASLYVLKLPLRSDEKPLWYANSSGRFIARTQHFLDPAEFRAGRLVTVAGEITGVETQPVQKVTYTYPVLSVRQLHIWPRVRRVYYSPGWGWGWGMYYPGWSGWYWGVGPGWGPGPGWWYPDWDEGDED